MGVFSAGKTISGGLNEAALNVNRPTLSNTKLTPYVLDNFASVLEAVEALKQVQMVCELALNREWPLTNINRKPFGGSLAMPGDPDPASRFVRGSQDYSGGDAEDVWTTLWTTVANLDSRTFYVQLARNPYAIWVDLNKVNFGRGGAMRLLDIQPDRLNGDATELLDRS